MFQKKYRLPATVHLFHPKNFYASYFIVRIAKNNLDYNRYGFIVSKKISKRAVVRNRLKRRFRAGVEGLQQSIIQGYDVLFTLKKEALEQATAVLYQELQKLVFREMEK